MAVFAVSATYLDLAPVRKLRRDSRLKPNPVHWKTKFLEAINKGFSKLQLCAITLTSQKPARLSRLTKTRATAFMTMRCRYSSSLSGHSYFERLGTGE